MISTAAKRGVASDEQLAAALDTMTLLNADAADAMNEADHTHAATDVTGFGLLGHLHTMVSASGVSARVDAGAVNLLPGVLDLARSDVVAGGTKRNHAWVSPTADWGDCTLPEQHLLSDAQTSGGLLIATGDPDVLRSALSHRGVAFAEVGEIVDDPDGRIEVVGRVRE